MYCARDHKELFPEMSGRRAKLCTGIWIRSSICHELHYTDHHLDVESKGGRSDAHFIDTIGARLTGGQWVAHEIDINGRRSTRGR